MAQGKKLPLMPKATAVWLVDNTSLTFKQIADFCGMHELEVKAIADGQTEKGIVGIDPIINGYLTREEILRCAQDSEAILELKSDYKTLEDFVIKHKGRKYIPLMNRRDKPDAIFWILKNYPSVEDSQIVKLIGTTKSIVSAIRDRTHWNSTNIRPRDPVLLGLCTQIELDELITKLKILQQNNNQT